jgi:putative phosphoesterase
VSRDVTTISAHTEKTVIGVRGNNEASFCSMPEYHILDTEYCNILLTHGHLDQVTLDLQKLIYRAEEAGCKAVFFGHTHAPMYEKIDDIHVLNPGSLSSPLRLSSGSYAIVDISEDEFSASIFYL